MPETEQNLNKLENQKVENSQDNCIAPAAIVTDMVNFHIYEEYATLRLEK